MDLERWRLLEEHFSAAVELSAADREGLLLRLSAADPGLAGEVGAMLRAHEREPLAIEEGLLAAGRGNGSDGAGDLVGRRVGPFLVLAPLGSGGMGDVYLAERDAPYHQRVALKVVRTGFRRDLRGRFLAERQILARLVHPNVATLLDGGVLEDGRPYLVMEHVDGVPITRWCDQRRLPVEQRLALFLTVCRAVEHAHRNLVVHRDLKPANLLVTDAGEVKLLDFGIAKLLSPGEAGAGETLAGLAPLTPDHAAPEQLRGEAITTAVDVYALGVLLYELLSGRRPYRLAGRTLVELLRVVCETEPPLPSVALAAGDREGTASDALAGAGELAAARGLGPAQLRRRLAGDLDAIVRKAMRKEPESRYRSAEQLAADVERHLEGRPVTARQGTAGYRAGRFLRRHAGSVAAAAALLVLLVGFSVFALLQARQVARERDLARAERDTAEQVARVLVGLFEASDPSKLPGGDALTVGELLRRSEARVLQQLAAQPRLQARVRRVLGQMYLARSELGPAQRHLEAALAQERRLGQRVEAAAVYHELALLARRRADPTAVPMLRRSLAQRRVLHGAESVEVAAALQDLAASLPPEGREEQLALFEQSLAMRRRLLPADDPAIGSSLHALGAFHLEARHDLAERYLREARGLLEAHPERGADHPETLATMGDLSLVFNRTTRFAEAEALLREVVARQTRVFGAASPAVGNTLNNLATNQTMRGDLEGAAETFFEVRRLHARLLGAEHWETANATRNLARVRELQGRYAEALPLMREAYAASLKRGEGGGRMRLVVAGQLGVLLVRTGERAEGLALLRQAHAELDAMFPGGHSHVADTAIALVRALAGSGAVPVALTAAELAEAERLARQALAIRAAQLAGDHPKLAEARCWLGMVLALQGREGEAAPLLREGLPLLAAWGAADPADLREARRRLAALGAPGP